MILFISAKSIQNSKIEKNARGNSVYSGTDYTFPVLSKLGVCVGVFRNIVLSVDK
jgi:hypothetical protein